MSLAADRQEMDGVRCRMRDRGLAERERDEKKDEEQEIELKERAETKWKQEKGAEREQGAVLCLD